MTDEELEEWVNLLKDRNKLLADALWQIASYPVHSEPVGGAMNMQDIAAKALGIFPK